MATVELVDVRKSYGRLAVLDGIDLRIRDGEFCVFVGPSGCGKSTLLRTVAGLDGSHQGSVRIGGRDVTALAPADRGVAMVFQSYALYPHMTVARNIGFGLFMQSVPKPVIAEKVAAAARLLQISELLERRPSELSGGQRQRVAIGRALVRQPEVFLFDEPLSNLDAALRVQMRIEITRLHAQLGTTMIYVTHDQTEAMTMADRIVVLNGGRVEQVGSPLELYHQPANLFVAGFIGAPRINILPVTMTSNAGATRLGLPAGGVVVLPVGGLSGPAMLGVRPESVLMRAPGEGLLSATVDLVEQLGGESLFHLKVQSGEHLIVKTSGLRPWRAGDQVSVTFPPDACHLFSVDGLALRHPEPEKHLQ